MIDTRTMLADLLHEIDLETIRSESRINLLKSFNEFYKINGYLTPAQEKALRNIYEEVIG